MKGYHIYSQFRDDSQYDSINHLALLTSILTWKKNFGSIHLYTNKRFLESISKWNIHLEYDSIDTYELENIPHKDYLEKYWTFPKIHITNIIAQRGEPFALVDTDLWIKDSSVINFDKDIYFYHSEIFNEELINSVYPNPNLWLTQSELIEYDWNTLPINTALVFFNSNFQSLISEWYSLSERIIERCKNNNTSNINPSSHTLFLEQRMLSTMANKMGINYGTILPASFITYVDTIKDAGNEWYPNLDSTNELIKIKKSIKHIWGIKKYYQNPSVREMIVSNMLDVLEDFDGVNQKYEKLYKEISLLFTQNS
jgi:hypothetical protein